MILAVYIDSDWEGNEAVEVGRHELPRSIAYYINKVSFHRGIQQDIFYVSSISGSSSGWVSSKHISKVWVDSREPEPFLNFLVNALDRSNPAELKELFNTIEQAKKEREEELLLEERRRYEQLYSL